MYSSLHLWHNTSSRCTECLYSRKYFWIRGLLHSQKGGGGAEWRLRMTVWYRSRRCRAPDITIIHVASSSVSIQWCGISCVHMCKCGINLTEVSSCFFSPSFPSLSPSHTPSPPHTALIRQVTVLIVSTYIFNSCHTG